MIMCYTHTIYIAILIFAHYEFDVGALLHSGKTATDDGPHRMTLVALVP